MGQSLLLALGLLLVLEGLLPLLAPKTWRETFRKLVELKDGQLRTIGLIMLVGGLFTIMLAS